LADTSGTGGIILFNARTNRKAIYGTELNYLKTSTELVHYVMILVILIPDLAIWYLNIDIDTYLNYSEDKNAVLKEVYSAISMYLINCS
jgi:hypothetical protein